MTSSESVSRGGSTSARLAWTTTERMSSRGWARRSATSAAPYAAIRRRSAATVAGAADPETPAGSSSGRMSNPGSTAAITQCRSSSGTPSTVQISCTGSSAATAPTTSTSAPSSRSASSRRVRRRSSTSSPATARRLKPVLTSRRIRAWRGSSIMWRTTPATGRSARTVPLSGQSPPRSEEEVAGSRSTARVSASVATDQNPLAVGRGGGRFVPPRRSFPAVDGEEVLEEAGSAGVEIGEVDLRQRRGRSGSGAHRASCCRAARSRVRVSQPTGRDAVETADQGGATRPTGPLLVRHRGSRSAGGRPGPASAPFPTPRHRPNRTGRRHPGRRAAPTTGSLVLWRSWSSRTQSWCCT
jgi:hypothetical protein